MALVESSSVVPMYEQIATIIRNTIGLGELKQGEKMPTEDELMTMYSVGRNTIRKAIEILSTEGLIEKKQGKGTFVKLPIHFENPTHDGSFTSSVEAALSIPSTTILEKKYIKAPKLVQEELNLDEYQKVLFISRVRKVDGIPAILEEDYFPMEYRFLYDKELENASIFKLLGEYRKTQLDSSKILFDAIAATTKHRDTLGIVEGQPVLAARQTVYCRKIPVYYNIQYIRSEVYKSVVYSSFPMND
ncbi:MAG: GntR family transcriptional regulator [Breznakia sp.]